MTTSAPPTRGEPAGTPKDEHEATAARPSPESREEWARFLSGLVHELKTPLASLGMITQLLGQDGERRLDEGAARYVRNLGELSREIQTLVNDTGVLARLWSGKKPVRRQPVSLSELLTRAEDAARGRGWERGVSLVTLLGPDLPNEIRTDPVLLEDSLGGLLETAIVLARENVSLRVSVAGSEIAFAVASDGGCGPGEDAAALFDPFQGATAHRIHRRGGRSLAPLLARELARALGGDVSLVSGSERTHCVLRLPLDG